MSQHRLDTMAQTPLAASSPPAPPLSSTFLVKLSNLVKSISLPPKCSMGQKLPEMTVRVSQLAAAAADVSDPSLCSEVPDRESIPKMALEEHRTALDELFEETEREIKALIEFWENSFVDDQGDSSLEIPWIRKRRLGHPLDLNDEGLREDPRYNKERVEQEALQDYLQELEKQKRVRAAVERAASQKRDAAASGGVEGESLALAGKLTIGAKASLSQGRPRARKKPCVILSSAGEAESTSEEPQGESGSPSSFSEEEEAAILPRKTPKRNLQNQDSGRGKRHKGNPPDRSERLQKRQQKVSGHRRHNRQQPVTDQSSEKSETSSSGDGQAFKPYNFRRQSKPVSYVSQQEEEEEEEEESSSEGSSEKDWVPEEEESDAEEEEDAEELDVEEEEEEDDDEAERGEESEADARPPQAEPQRKNRPKTVRRYRCPVCDREFSNSSNMQKHLLVHSGERPYGCHVCGKSYAHPSNLTKHQLVHMSERRHVCPTCPKTFYTKSHLDAHIRRHLGIRPFACMECRSTFCSRVDLLMHMRIHTEGKGAHRRQTPVRCTECNKTFPGPSHLRQHQKRHRNLVCEDCGEVFAFRFKYKFHRSLHASCICVQCGVNYKGAHLCQGPAWNAERPQRATQKSSALAPQGVVPKQPEGTATRPESQKQTVGSTQVATQSSGNDGSSGLAGSRLWTDVGASQRNTPLIPVIVPRQPEGIAARPESQKQTVGSTQVATPSSGNDGSSGLSGSRLWTDVGASQRNTPLIPVVVPRQPEGIAARPESQKQTVGSTQAATQSSGTDGLSVSASSRPSTDVGASQRNTPLIPIVVPSQSEGIAAWAESQKQTVSSTQAAAQSSGTDGPSGSAGSRLWTDVGASQRNTPLIPVVVPRQPEGIAARDESQKQTVGSTQAATQSSSTDGPFISASSRVSTDVGASQRNTPLIPVACPVLDHRRAEPSTPVQKPLELKPVGVLLQNMPVVGPATPTPATAQPFAQIPALPCPPGLITLLPHSQAPVAFPVLAAALPRIALQTLSHPRPLPFMIPVGPPQLLGSNPFNGAVNSGFILLNPAMLPAGSSIIWEIPSQIGLPVTAQICATCQATYLGTHQCRKLPQDRAEISEEEEPRIHQVGAEDSTAVPCQASPVHPPCPQGQEEGDPLAKSHGLCQADSQVTSTCGDEEESGSDTEGDWEEESEEVELPEADKHLGLPVENGREQRRNKRRKSRYMCNVCDKRFVHLRSLKQHRRMHMAFSCDQCDASFLRSEQLKQHKLCHAKETTVWDS